MITKETAYKCTQHWQAAATLSIVETFQTIVTLYDQLREVEERWDARVEYTQELEERIEKIAIELGEKTEELEEANFLLEYNGIAAENQG